MCGHAALSRPAALALLTAFGHWCLSLGLLTSMLEDHSSAIIEQDAHSTHCALHEPVHELSQGSPDQALMVMLIVILMSTPMSVCAGLAILQGSRLCVSTADNCEERHL